MFIASVIVHVCDLTLRWKVWTGEICTSKREALLSYCILHILQTWHCNHYVAEIIQIDSVSEMSVVCKYESLRYIYMETITN